MNESITGDPLVSVIIPCYNHGRYLAYAIDSVLTQNYDRIEIIVIDDGSVDDTAMVAKKYDQVIYYYQTNQGLSASRNRGVELSKGDFIVFLDADDWLLPNAIQLNLQKLQQHPEAALVSGAHIFYYQPEERQTQTDSKNFRNMENKSPQAMSVKALRPQQVSWHCFELT